MIGLYQSVREALPLRWKDIMDSLSFMLLVEGRMETLKIVREFKMEFITDPPKTIESQIHRIREDAEKWDKCVDELVKILRDESKECDIPLIIPVP